MRKIRRYLGTLTLIGAFAGAPSVASAEEDSGSSAPRLHISFGVVGAPYVLRARQSRRTYVGAGLMPEFRVSTTLRRGSDVELRLYGAWRYIGLNTLSHPSVGEVRPAEPATDVEMMATGGIALAFNPGDGAVDIPTKVVSCGIGWANVATRAGSSQPPYVDGFVFIVSLHLDALAIHVGRRARRP